MYLQFGFFSAEQYHHWCICLVYSHELFWQNYLKFISNLSRIYNVSKMRKIIFSLDSSQANDLYLFFYAINSWEIFLNYISIIVFDSKYTFLLRNQKNNSMTRYIAPQCRSTQDWLFSFKEYWLVTQRSNLRRVEDLCFIYLLISVKVSILLCSVRDIS